LGIYDTHIKLRGSPVLEEPGLDFHQNFIFEKLQVEDMMRSKVLALPPIVPVQAVLQVLQNSTLAAIPLTWDTEAASQDKEGSVFRIEGVIKTQTLLKMLKHRIGFWVCFKRFWCPRMWHEHLRVFQQHCLLCPIQSLSN
jgi:hypothetical protein